MSASPRSIQSWSWNDLWIVGALVAAAILAFSRSWTDIYLQASRREDNGYIFLVPAVAGFLVWLRRSRMRFVPRRPSLTAVPIVALAVLLSWWGEQADIRAAVHLGAILALAACAVAMAGLEVVRQFFPAFLALAFLIPVPAEVRKWLAAPLQALAVTVTQEVLDVVGVATERAGNSIQIAGRSIFVGEACDGMRMVFALALTFFAFVFSVPLRLNARVALLATAPVIAIACNVVRLVPTALAYAYASAEDAERFHDIAGWLMLPLAIVMLFGLIRFMRWLDLPVFTWRFIQA
jgi:exosortase